MAGGELRPIGTEFWSEPWYSYTEMDGYVKRFLYRIIAHSRVRPMGMDGPAEWSETLEPVRMQRARVTGFRPADPLLPIWVPTYGEWEGDTPRA